MKFLIILLFILNKNYKKYINATTVTYLTTTKVYEYEEFKRLGLFDKLFNKQAAITSTTVAPITTEESFESGIIECFGDKPTTSTTTLKPIAMEQILSNNHQFPSLCKGSPSEQDTQTKLYCFALLALWIMLMFSALIYQIRTIWAMKKLKGKGKSIKDDVEAKEDIALKQTFI
jgi:hypothetical protein